MCIRPVGVQKVSGHQTGVQFLSDVEFVQFLADEDDFSFPISEVGVPCLFDVHLVLGEGLMRVPWQGICPRGCPSESGLQLDPKSRLGLGAMRSKQRFG